MDAFKNEYSGMHPDDFAVQQEVVAELQRLAAHAKTALERNVYLALIESVADEIDYFTQN